MLLWFVGTALAMVWFVFRDAHFPFAAVAIGALLPDLIGLVPGAVAPTHSIVVVVSYLALAMILTIGRRALRKRLLAVAFGLFMHLVADFVFASDELFWWPLGGVSIEQSEIPTLERALAVNVGLEVLGTILLVWFLRRLAVAREVR
jgi:hypothetical protein